MENYTEFVGRTVEEAIEEGLKTLGLTEEEADIRILEEGKKKLFSSVKARVEIAPKAALNVKADAEESSPSGNGDGAEGVHIDAQGRTDGQRAVEFIEGLFDILKITACTELVREAEKIEINVTAANTTSVIGKRGAMLDAVQTIAGAVANTGRTEYKRVVVDCENYRENREITLRNLANKLAVKAVRMEKKLKLEPMNPYERRIIHAALSENTEVTTQSEGKEPHRCIVIVPNNVRYPDRPATPVRPERPQRGGYNDRGGYKKPYNKDFRNQGDGYRKPYNQNGYKKYNRDDKDGNGYRKPYNQGGYNRDRYQRDDYNNRGPRENKGENGTNFSERRDNYDRPRTTSYKKPSSDFFGTYLGNSKDNKDE